MSGHERQRRQTPSPSEGHRLDARDSPDRAGALHRAAGNQALAALVQGQAPLATPAREELEQAYDVDLGRARVHTGPEAAAAARVQGALAFTRGDDVYLAGGSPHVIEHELAHLLQQAGGTQAPRLSTDALEQQATPGSEVTVGAAPRGAVQRWEWPWEEEEKQEIDPAAKQRLVDELSVDKSAWKRHLDDPVSAEILRTHSQIQLSYADDAEFQEWMGKPSYRPPGSAPKRTTSEFSQASEAKRVERAAAEAEAEAKEKAEAPVAKPTPETDWATAQNRKTLKQRAKSAYETGTGAKHKMETERHAPLEMYIGKLERSLLSYEQGIKSIPFVRAAVPIVQTVAGEDILGREKSRWSAAGEAISDIVLDFGSLLAPEDLMALGGEGKAVAAVEEGVAARAAEEGLAGRAVEERLAGLQPKVTKPGVSPIIELPPTGGAEALGRGGQTLEGAGTAAEGTVLKGEGVDPAHQMLFEPPRKAGAPSSGFASGGTQEIEIAGQRMQRATGPQPLPEAAATPKPTTQPTKLQLPPELAGEAGAAKSGWAEAEAQAAKEGIRPMKDVALKRPPAELEATPLIDRVEREFPAAEKRPPITEPEIRPPLMIDPEKRDEKAEFPSERKPEELPLPKEEDREPMILAPTGKKQKKQKKQKQSKLDKEIDEAFKEDPTGPDIAPDKSKRGLRKIPEAEEIKPQSREVELSTKKREQLLADEERIATREIPSITDEVVKAQDLTPTRKRLAELKDQFEDLMRKVGNRRELTPAQRKEAESILEEARVLARDDFGNVQKSVWLRLRQHPELAKIEQQLRKTGDVGPGERALQIPMKEIGESGTEFESLGLEHRTRLSDDPWSYNHKLNLIVTDAAQNEQYLEAIRRHGIWPTGKTEEFVVRHGLSSQPYDFAPGSRPIGKKPGP